MSQYAYALCMIRIEFTQQQLDDIAEAIDNPEISDKLKCKLLALRMYHQKVRNQVIAEVLNIHVNTVTIYISQYSEGGLSTVLEDRAYRPSSSLEPFFPCLKCLFSAVPPISAKHAMHLIKKATGISLSEEQTRRMMLKLGLKYRKTAMIPGKANANEQLEFFTEKLEPRLKQAAKGERKVFFVDAAHFVLGCFLGMVWCFRRLFIKSGSGRQRYSILGAVDSHDKEILSVRTTGSVNADCVCLLINQVREKHHDLAITMVLDNARYQHCGKVKEHAISRGVELLFLPAYSPNLNLIERLWKLMKSKCLRNRYFSKFAEFRAAIDTFLDQANSEHQAEMESLLTLKFQQFTNP